MIIVFVAALTAAQPVRLSPFTGAWKFNANQSEFNPGPPFKSFTLTFTRDGVRHLDLIAAGGQTLKAELPWSDGKEVAVVVREGAMANVKAVSEIRGRTFEDTWRQDGKVIERVHGVVSRDGKTLVVNVEGPLQQGGTFRNRVVFDKQEAAGQ